MSTPRREPLFVHIEGRRLAYEQYAPAPGNERTLVFLHEGLGSIGGWRDVPAALCARTGLGGLVYDRLGYGASDPLVGPLSQEFMHREAQDVLPRLLEQLDIRRPVLVGHSDGASIALIYAGSVARPEALVLEAPHVFVEDVTTAGLRRLRETFASGPLRASLARHHDGKVDHLFNTWTDLWLSSEFRDWNIEALLPRVSCPALVIQGRDDEYATLRQVSAIQTALAGDVQALILSDCRHVPHHQRRGTVESAIARFLTTFQTGP